MEKILLTLECSNGASNVAIIDKKKQQQRKNIYWGDFPVILVAENGKIRKSSKTLRYYYESWNQYIEKGWPIQKNMGL